MFSSSLAILAALLLFRVAAIASFKVSFRVVGSCACEAEPANNIIVTIGHEKINALLFINMKFYAKLSQGKILVGNICYRALTLIQNSTKWVI